MPAVQYPFIDIAVHPRVRERFARGEAMVLFSADLARPLWANGAGAELFGQSAVYDLLDQGIDRTSITFRQLETTARQVAVVGDNRNFMVRITQGFQRVPVQAAAELIVLSSGERAILLSLPVSAKPLSTKESAEHMLRGLDDPDTHMAVIGGDGEIIAASPGFASLDVSRQTARSLTALAGEHAHRLVKRPVATGKGHLPAAVGRLSDNPALNLLFAVETVIGHLDPVDPPAAEPDLSTAAVNHNDVVPASNFSEVINAVAAIEELEEAPDEAEDTSSTAGEELSGEDATVAVEADEAEPLREDIGETVEAAEDAGEETIDEDEIETVIEADTVAASALEPVVDEASVEESSDPAVTDLDDQVEEELAPVLETETETHEVQPQAAPSAAPEQVAANTNSFVFNPNSRATRFVWKIDAQGRFSEVSGEFAEAVGPQAASIIGVAFSDIAALFNLDPDGKISEALARRDTWSGKTIHWPIEGTSLAVPVDLAALPTYTRSREFDGFRGFGVVRLSDAAEDPLALGLTFGPHDIVEDAVGADQPEETIEESPASPEIAPAEPEEAIVAPEADIEAPEESSLDGDDPVVVLGEAADEPVVPPPSEPPARVEPPALRIAETPNRRLTDKIVQLHGVGSTLTSAEQANFREIAKRLEAFGVRAPETDGDEAETDAARPDEKHDAGLPDETQTEEIGEDQIDAMPAEHDLEEETPAEVAVDSDDDSDVTEGLEETVSQMDMLTSFIPPRVKMLDGLSPATVDQLPVAVLIHAGDNLLHANPEFLRLTGYSSLEDLEDTGGIDALLQRHELEEQGNRSGKMMLVTADDDLVPVTARLQSIRWEESSALMLALMPVTNDASVRARHVAPPEGRSADRMIEKVAKLQVEVEELRSILETATDGVVVIGAEGDIRSMNRSASALFNYDEEETRGKPFVMLFAHESQRAVLDYLSGLSGHGVASVLNDGREVIGREAAGGFVPLFMTMGRLTSSSGYCAVIRDITQWKRTEDELRSAKSAAETANDHKTDFLARVSHEIRTPLNAIIGFSDMMAGERFGPIGNPRYVEYANDIGRSGRHVLDIVNDLLDISKIEAGEMDLDFAAVGLNEAVSEAVALLQPQANGQRVIIRTALSQAVPDVVADLRSIKQIALNVLSNSIRFTPAGGQIVVSTSYEANGSVVLRIRDTGVGMTRSELDQAMKPFRQVSTQSRHRGEGTGLGLPLTKAMVDANRAIFAISSAPNEGTLVEIAFPSQRVLAG
ncbi:PAS domain-containing sensor histidine kinase [Rhizobium sp. AC44/96]|uniref:PAS domain S-box protein n=1 Tax=Rhizobium sp. AC44/96 TaxID=1841654 RepID=UPI00080F993D|nr:PAS domain S-box protein [Rhizobium sp. AC44/96]OCJ17730.1 PAS domain-containing sensor histidine kinase [Rhizobium sp. AC44/96]